MDIDQYRSLNRDVCRLLMNHFGKCRKCQENLDKFKACLNHPGLLEEDLVADLSPKPGYNFSECPDWRQIRRPLTDFEAFLEDEDIEKLVGNLVGANEPTDQTEAGFLRRYFQESRKSAIALVQN